MINKLYKIFTVIALSGLLAIITRCNNEKDFIAVYDVPGNFQNYVNTFIEEAALRGNNYQIENLIIQYDDELEIPFCGKCNSNKQNANFQKIISINPKFACWENAYQAEAFIFHELGHCYLGRLHLEDTLPNGDPKSMMVSDNISIYSPCIYQFDDNECNFIYKRDYYIDELFDESTPVPDWAKK